MKVKLLILIFSMTIISNNIIGQTQTNKALLIIDIQNDFTGQNAKMPVDSNQAIQMITSLNRIIDKSKELDLTIIYIGNEYSKYNILNIFRNFAAIKGSNGIKIDNRLHFVTENYFSKNKMNAFSNRQLDFFLKEKNITEVFIGGLYAEACIYGTTKGAIRNNYLTTILTDCIATKTDAKRNKMIEKYKKLGARTITSNQL
jgi:nicotinamidase-related amidase